MEQIKSAMTLDIYSAIAGLIAAACAAIFDFTAPVAQMIELAVTLIVADMLTAWIADYMTQEGENRKSLIGVFESGKAALTLVKGLLYMVAILVAHGISVTVAPEVELELYCTRFIAGVEFYSFLENMGRATGRDVGTLIRDSFRRITKGLSDAGGPEEKEH